MLHEAYVYVNMTQRYKCAFVLVREKEKRKKEESGEDADS
jgi:hypothetical protein